MSILNLWEKSGWYPVLMFLASLSLSSCSGCESEQERVGLNTRVIAHALGGMDGKKTYLNCKECFLENYKKGFRYFEADFHESTDGFIVVAHARVNLTRENHLSKKKKGYTRLDLPGLVSLFNTHPDARLVTDCKIDNRRCLTEVCDAYRSAGLDYKELVIPQIYFPEEIAIVKEMGFKQVIFTLYLYGNHVDAVIDFIKRNRQITGLTVPWQWMKHQYKELSDATGTSIFVHTLNDPQHIETLFKQGVDGIYTDFYMEGQESSNR